MCTLIYGNLISCKCYFNWNIVYFSMATASVKFENYCPEEEDFETYCERLEQYFIVANITEKKIKVATLLSNMGSKLYSTLKDLAAPTKQSALKFDEICQTMKDYYMPEKPTLAHRYAVYRRQQHSGETVTNFMTALKKQAEKCKFGTMCETMIRDMLVCGLRDRGTQL